MARNYIVVLRLAWSNSRIPGGYREASIAAR
jgi:hypothetical protein